MSELKSFSSCRIYRAVDQVEWKTGDIDNLRLDDNLFYIKSEADKVIEELKHQRDGAFGLTNSGLTLDDISQMARKQLDHQKYKRCLAMADFCESQYDFCNTLGNGFWLVRGDKEKRDEYRKKASDFWWKWRQRWLDLAEKFKEANNGTH